MTLLSCLLASTLALPGCGSGGAPAGAVADAAATDVATAVDIDEKARPRWAGGNKTGSTSTSTTTTTPSTTTTTTPTTTTTTTTTVTSEPLVAATAAGYQATDPRLARLYGGGTQVMDALANIRVGEAGGYVYVTSQRFRAPKSGSVASIKAVWPQGSGYASGDGGTIRVRIVPDDGTSVHAPSLGAAALATGQHRPGMVDGIHQSAGGNFAEVPLTASAPLVAGALYHVVYENVAANPSTDYVSIDYSVVHERNGRPDRWVDPLDWGGIFGYRVAGGSGSLTWIDLSRTAYNGAVYAPILQVRMADGSLFGKSTMESGNVEGRQWSAVAAAPVRERFTPKTSRVITGLSFSTAATIAGSLRWEIRNGSTVMASGRVTESAPNYAAQAYGRAVIGVMKWYDVAMPAPVALTAGGVYDVVFIPEGASEWRFADVQNGSTYGFSWPASFVESQAQHLLNGSWINANHWDHASPGQGSNWRMVLHASQ